MARVTSRDACECIEQEQKSIDYRYAMGIVNRMTRHTVTLRFLLVLMLGVLLVLGGALDLMSTEAAHNWPELSHLQYPVLIACVAALAPVVVAIVLVFGFLEAVDRGDVFTSGTVQVLRRVRLLIGVFAAYLTLGLAVFWLASGMMHPTLLFGWFACEVTALICYTLVALLERIFAVALELREDHELTV